MDNSMEQRFVDRLLHTLAAMSEYTPVPPEAAASEQLDAEAEAGHAPIKH